jgi:hypothetical protein
MTHLAVLRNLVDVVDVVRAYDSVYLRSGACAEIQPVPLCTRLAPVKSHLRG